MGSVLLAVSEFPVEFEQQAQEDLYARVAMYLRQAFGELPEPLEGEAAFRLDIGRVNLLVSVDASGPEKASVTVYNVLADGLTITPEVALYLLRKNWETPFGTLCLNHEDVIAFNHIMFGESVTKETLSMLLQLLAAYSEEIEDELNMRFR